MVSVCCFSSNILQALAPSLRPRERACFAVLSCCMFAEPMANKFLPSAPHHALSGANTLPAWHCLPAGSFIICTLMLFQYNKMTRHSKWPAKCTTGIIPPIQSCYALKCSKRFEQRRIPEPWHPELSVCRQELPQTGMKKSRLTLPQPLQTCQPSSVWTAEQPRNMQPLGRILNFRNVTSEPHHSFTRASANAAWKNARIINQIYADTAKSKY